MARETPITEKATLLSSGLPNPGPFEQLSKETRGNEAVQGLRACSPFSL